MTAPIGISWEGCRDGEAPAGGDDDSLPSRIHAARGGGMSDAWPFRSPQIQRPSLWSRLKSWAENLFTDPDGDDE